ncbi:MAG: hypothetical protein JW809_05440 [Pirellulales bacterium]|nr:hypothetical protein [Pirellulales bacterium]
MLLAILATWLLLAGGCGKKTPARNGEHLSPEEYGSLPGLRATSNQALRDELARIEEERATPQLLTAAEKIPDELNAAVVLQDLFRAADLPALLASTDEYYPKGKFEFNLLRLRQALKSVARHEDRRRAAREALARPHCDFGFRHDQGWLANKKFIDAVRLFGRLEAFHAAEQLFLKQDVAAAVESLGCQFRLAEALGRVKNVEARLEAAYLREEILRVLRAVVSHEQIQAAQLVVLRDMIQDHLRHWPDDADVWIGDRALGMYVYEVVRDGAILALLTPDDVRAFGDERVLDELTDVARDTADPDELYYLTAMRELIARCKQSHLERVELAEEIRKDLEAKRNSPDYPLVADRLLLQDLANALRKQTRDRALVEAWALALDLATGEKSPYQVNPLTGRPYRVERDANRVAVWLDDQAPKDAPPDTVVLLPPQ